MLLNFHGRGRFKAGCGALGGGNSGADCFPFSDGFSVTPRSKRHGRLSKSQLIQRTEAQSVRGGSPRCGCQQFDSFLLVLRRKQSASSWTARPQETKQSRQPRRLIEREVRGRLGNEGRKSSHVGSKKKATAGWTEGGRKRVWWSEARIGKKIFGQTDESRYFWSWSRRTGCFW